MLKAIQDMIRKLRSVGHDGQVRLPSPQSYDCSTVCVDHGYSPHSSHGGGPACGCPRQGQPPSAPCDSGLRGSLPTECFVGYYRGHLPAYPQPSLEEETRRQTEEVRQSPLVDSPFSFDYDPYQDLLVQHNELKDIRAWVRQINEIAGNAQTQGKPTPREVLLQLSNLAGGVYTHLARLEDIIAELEVSRYGRIRSELVSDKYQEETPAECRHCGSEVDAQDLEPVDCPTGGTCSPRMEESA
jgi:hypothetical protein